MAKNIGYAVVGLGVGSAHAAGAMRAEGADLVAVCDLRDDRLEAAAKKYPDARRYYDFAEMLKCPDIDVVSIATPSGIHSDMAVQALRAGKHVLCEKPLDVTVERAMRIVRAQEETGLKVGCIFQNRRNPVMEPVKKAIDEGRLGKVFAGNFAVKWYRDQKYYDAGGWRGTWEMDGGGSLMNQSVHTVDLMQWLMGDVKSVIGTRYIYGHKIDTEDCTMSIVKFKSGATASFFSTTCAWPGISTDIQVMGENGAIYVDGDRLTRWTLRDADDDEEYEMLEQYGSEGSFAASNPERINGHDWQVQDMVDAVRFDRDPAVCPREGIKALRIIRAIYESSESGGKEVFLEDLD